MVGRRRLVELEEEEGVVVVVVEEEEEEVQRIKKPLGPALVLVLAAFAIERDGAALAIAGACDDDLQE